MANIQINDTAQIVKYTANALDTTFSVPFPFLANGDIEVYDGTTLMVEGAGAGQYGLTGAGTASGGTVTWVTAATGGEFVTIYGNLDVDRTSIYSAALSNLTGSDLNNDFNRDVLMIKQLETAKDILTLTYLPTAAVSQDPTVTTDRTIPLLAAGYGWRKNAGDTAIAAHLIPAIVAGVDATITTDNVLMKTDTSGTNQLQETGVTVDDSDNVSGVGTLTIGGALSGVTSLTMNGALSGVTTLSMGGALSGATTIAMGGALTGATSITMNGALSGATTISMGGALTGATDITMGGALTGVTSLTMAGALATVTNLTMTGALATVTNLTMTGALATPTSITMAGPISGATDITASGTLIASGLTYPTSDGTPGQVLNTDGAGTLTFGNAADGDVDGPASSTDNAYARFDGTTGKLLQNSQVTESDTGAVVFPSTVTLNADPVAALGAVTKQYADAIASGLEVKSSVVAAGTADLTVTYDNGTSGVGATLTNADTQAAFSLDGVSPSATERVLIKDQSTAFQNGIYTVTTVGDGSTNWVLTRATDHDSASEMALGSLIPVDTGGTVNALTSWLQTSTVTTVGTDAVDFSQFTYGTTFPSLTAGNISLSGNTITTTDTNGDLNINADGTGNILFNGNDAIFGDPGTEASGITVGGVTYEAAAKVSDLGGTNVAQFIIHRHSTTLAPMIVASRSNTNDNTHAVVTDGQELLAIYGVGYDGTDYEIGAKMEIEVDGTPGSNDMPGRFVFSVTPDGSATPAEALRISQDKVTLVTGTLDVTHTATATDDHALDVAVNAAGYGDVRGIELDYTTGAIAVGQDEAVILVNIDESLATGGDVIALEVLATEGSATMRAMGVGALVAPLVQLSGSFGDMDSALVNAVDRLAEFISTGSDIALFVANSDTVTIGNAAKFEEIEFLLDTVASGAGVKPTFEFSTGISTWTTFTPTDGTNGFRQNGVIAWLDGDIPTWATGTGTEYLIRITRTQNSLTTVPIEDLVQIAVTTEFGWDKDADVTAASLSLKDGTNQIVLDSDGNAGTISWAPSTTRTLTLPDATDTVVGKATTDTFTNKTFDANGTGNSLSNVDVADLADGTDGELITWDASGNAATVAVGTATHVLTSNGAGAAPTFQAAAGGGGGLVYIASASASSSASVTFSSSIDSTYDHYVIEFVDVVPATSSILNFRTSTDGGSTYDSTSGDYDWRLVGISGNESGVETSEIALVGVSASLGTGSTNTCSGRVNLWSPSVAGTFTQISYDVSVSNNGLSYLCYGSGQRDAAGDVDAIQFIMATGNINSGEFHLYGVATS